MACTRTPGNRGMAQTSSLLSSVGTLPIIGPVYLLSIASIFFYQFALLHFLDQACAFLCINCFCFQ